MTDKNTNPNFPQYGRGDQLLTDKEVAGILACSAKVLRSWRVAGSPIPFVVVGSRMIRYWRSDVEAYLAARKRSSTSGTGFSDVQ